MTTRWVHLRDDQRGQIVPFVTILLPTLLLFVALVVNVGQAVNRRVAVQLMADTSAFSGATVMAVHLNRMAWANKQIQRAWNPLTIATGSFFASPFHCGLVSWVPSVYNIAAGGLRIVIEAFNRSGNYRARNWARNVAFGDTGNGPELFPGEHQQLRGDFWTSPGVISGDNIVPGWIDNLEPLLDLSEVPDDTEANTDWKVPFLDYTSRKSAVWTCVVTYVPPVVAPQSSNFIVWVKEDSEPETFLAAITAPETPARMFPGVFGKLPEMHAIAAAKPIGGSIAEGRSEYVVSLVPVGSAFWPTSMVGSPFSLENRLRFIFH